MLRRFLKRLGYSWKRFRKSLKKKQNQQEYEEKLAELKQLIELYKADYLDLRFADESGFNLEGYVPYGWQPTGEYIEITPAKTKGTQVFGLMNLDNQLQAYAFEGSITSRVVMACLDDFHTTANQPTVVVLDNASIHHSKEFEAKVEQWKQDDLYVFFLPTYSPHLNPIEILWRKIKYEWLPYEAIESQQALNDKLEEILRSFGENYTINFKQKNQKVANIFA
jgi:transposase